MLFKSLQLDLPIHRFDIQHALDCCENENIMEIDITKFLLNVCGHANTQNFNHGDTSEKKKGALFSNENITKHDTSIDDSENHSESKLGATKSAPMNCDELFDSYHVGIKRKLEYSGAVSAFDIDRWKELAQFLFSMPSIIVWPKVLAFWL